HADGTRRLDGGRPGQTRGAACQSAVTTPKLVAHSIEQSWARPSHSFKRSTAQVAERGRLTAMAPRRTARAQISRRLVQEGRGRIRRPPRQAPVTLQKRPPLQRRRA